jgi:hypothetical protein
MLTKRFTFLYDDDEQRLLLALSKRLKRSQSDTVRFLITAAAEELGIAKKLVEEPEQQAKVGDDEKREVRL